MFPIFRIGAIAVLIGSGSLFVYYVILVPGREVQKLAAGSADAVDETQKTVQEFAQYLNQTNGKIVADRSPASETPGEDPSIQIQENRGLHFDDVLENLSHAEYRRALLDNEAQRFHEIVDQIHTQMNKLDPTEETEKLHLLRVAKQLSEVYPSDSIKNLFFEAADKEQWSSSETSVSRTALQYYLDLEPDPQTRQQLFDEFVARKGVGHE